MALNFPANPYANQQVSAGGNVWIWDGTVWNLLSTSGGGGTGGTSLQVSDTPPSNPDPGSLWFNSLDGNLYVYYEDDDGAQWVQPASTPYGATGGGGSGSFTGGLVANATTFASTTLFQGAITAAAVKNIVPFHYMDQTEFPSAAGNQGAILHSHADGRFYGAHDGMWEPVANLSDLQSLPVASTSVLGAVKVDGTTITVSNGVISTVSTGTVNAGTAGRLAYYPSTGNTVDDLSALSWNNTNTTLSVTGRIVVSTATSIVRSYYPDLTTLQGAVNSGTYSGALAYSANENHVYVATGTSWMPLANSSDITNSFYRISVNGQEDIIAESTTQGLTITAGTNITLTSDNTAKRLTINASAVQSNSFATIAVAGQSNVVADNSADTLTLVAGPNITITTNAGSDSITISATSGGGGSSGVSTGSANRLAYYASTGQVVEDTGANLTWNGSTLTVTGTVSATTFSGSGASLTSIPNTSLVNSSIGFTAGTGIVLSGNTISLGQNLTITNGGVTSLSANTGISLSGSTGSIAITNSGVTSITAGTGISVNQSTGGVTITATSTGVTSVVAGTGAISVNTVNGVATINNLLTRLNNLSDATNTVYNGSSLTIDKIALPAATMYAVLFRSTLAYTFLSHIPGDNPTLYALAGTTIAFNLQVPGHPFALQTTAGVNLDPSTNTSLGTFFWVGTDGTIAENADAQGKILGTLYWIIGPNAAGTYRYQCTLHPAMRGNIVIKNITSLA
jgi:plastocyanin